MSCSRLKFLVQRLVDSRRESRSGCASVRTFISTRRVFAVVVVVVVVVVVDNVPIYTVYLRGNPGTPSLSQQQCHSMSNR